MSETLKARKTRAGGFLAPDRNPLLGGLQWYSRNCMSWTLFLIAAVGIPALYYKDQIGIGYVNLLGQYMAFAIVAVSLDLVWGYAGMLCLCQAFFFCLGGYAMGMYLAHHGGPEGIIDHNGWKLPACLYVVYPYKVGEAPADAMVPWFWKPMWNLWSTILMGALIPGLVAGLIGFFVFRSRVRGVFFAVLTQAIKMD
jgi:urea transport system permease protein